MIIYVHDINSQESEFNGYSNLTSDTHRANYALRKLYPKRHRLRLRHLRYDVPAVFSHIYRGQHSILHTGSVHLHLCGHYNAETGALEKYYIPPYRKLYRNIPCSQLYKISVQLHLNAVAGNRSVRPQHLFSVLLKQNTYQNHLVHGSYRRASVRHHERHVCNGRPAGGHILYAIRKGLRQIHCHAVSVFRNIQRLQHHSQSTFRLYYH